MRLNNGIITAAVLASTLAGWGQAKAQQVVWPPSEGDLTDNWRDKTNVPSQQVPYAVIAPPDLKGFAGNVDLGALLYDVLLEIEKSPPATYTQSLITKNPGMEHVLPAVAALYFQLYGFQRRTIETHAGNATLVSDRAAYDAIATCVGRGVTVGGIDYTAYHPDIFAKCVEAYKDPKWRDATSGKPFVEEMTGLPSATGSGTAYDSVVTRLFTNDTYRGLVWNYLGDSRLEDGRMVSHLILEGENADYYPDSNNNPTYYFQGLYGRLENLQEGGSVLDTIMGSDCGIFPAPPQYQWRTDLPDLQPIPIDTVVYHEAHKDTVKCPKLRGALAAEAVQREARIVVSLVGFVQARAGIQPIMLEQIWRMRERLRVDLEAWIEDQKVKKSTYADVQAWILQLLRERLEAVAKLIFNYKGPF
ncbi:MAG: hypothetical protein HYY13_13535 [Nitrospirae bacterium]|nr:hypothetical protein [Nitrospirota bacterium]